MKIDSHLFCGRDDMRFRLRNYLEKSFYHTHHAVCKNNYRIYIYGQKNIVMKQAEPCNP